MFINIPHSGLLPNNATSATTYNFSICLFDIHRVCSRLLSERPYRCMSDTVCEGHHFLKRHCTFRFLLFKAEKITSFRRVVLVWKQNSKLSFSKTNEILGKTAVWRFSEMLKNVYLTSWNWKKEKFFNFLNLESTDGHCFRKRNPVICRSVKLKDCCSEKFCGVFLKQFSAKTCSVAFKTSFCLTKQHSINQTKLESLKFKIIFLTLYIFIYFIECSKGFKPIKHKSIF